MQDQRRTQLRDPPCPCRRARCLLCRKPKSSLISRRLRPLTRVGFAVVGASTVPLGPPPLSVMSGDCLEAAKKTGGAAACRRRRRPRSRRQACERLLPLPRPCRQARSHQEAGKGGPRRAEAGPGAAPGAAAAADLPGCCRFFAASGICTAALHPSSTGTPPPLPSNKQREKKEQKEREEAEKKALLKVRRAAGCCPAGAAWRCSCRRPKFLLLDVPC